MLLLRNQEHEEEAFVCVREIFSFRETADLREYHSKIAARLFRILEELLAQHQEEQSQPVCHGDKQSESTNTSRPLRSLHSHTSPA